MPGDLVRAMSATGIFSLAVPRALGGQEALLVEIMRAIESVATADGSAGWCAMIGSSSNMAAGLPFASGITHCSWVWAGCVVVEGGAPVMTPHGPEVLHVWMPVSEVEIHDTWHVSGLRGTGRNDFSVSDVCVPSSLQRHMRDAEAVTHHFTVAPHTWEDAGRVLLGRKLASAVF
jgi:alkylation response protein AidB-like acyl-CoA dehydrogenase